MEAGNDIGLIADAWITALTSEEGSPTYEGNRWAGDQLLDWAIEGDAERLWQFVQTAYKREMPDDVFAVLAAGPLEDLLSGSGPAYIDRVEELARKDERFNQLLGGVWKNRMTDEVWHRVTAVRRTVW